MKKSKLHTVVVGLLILTSFLFWSHQSYASTVMYDVGDLRYTVDTESQSAELYGLVNTNTTIYNLVIPDFIDYQGLQIPVTSIRNYAFENRVGLTGSLIIGKNIHTIGQGAFAGCSGFSGPLIIGENVQTINNRAFYSCAGFTGSLSIPDNVQIIGNYAFYSCSGFTGSLTIGNKVQEIGENAFQKCSGFTGSLTIPNSVEIIDKNAFAGCSGFTGSLIIGKNVQTIGLRAFDNCSGFKGSLIIPNSVKTLEDMAFYNCSGFTGSLTIGDNVEIIGPLAFSNCSGFTGPLTIPNSVQTIGEYAFSGCSGFTGPLTIPNSVQTIGIWAFNNCSGFTGPLTIPNSVQTIGDRTFSGCSGFTGPLTIPNSVQTIGDWAFSNCSGFTGPLTIGDSVQIIGSQAFNGCSGFTSLYLPNTINSYNNMTFYYMPLKEVTCLANTPPAIENSTFSAETRQSACLYVPSQFIENYKSATYWKDFNCINNIKVLPSSLTVKPTETTLGIGGTLDLEIVIFPEEAEDADLTFTSSNAQVAIVDDDGKITALSEGKTTIIVESENGLTATCEVTVIPILAESVILSTENLNLLVGQTDKLSATVTPENTTDKTITWKSDNESVATVGADGEVTAIAVGVANITATCDKATATCKVTVYGPDDVTVKPGDGTSEGDEDDTPGNNTENGGSLVGNDLTLRVNQSAAIDLVIPEGLSVEPKFAWHLDNGGAEFVSMTVNDNTLSATFKGLKVGKTGYTVSITGVNGNIEVVKGKIMVIAENPMTSLELDPASIIMAQNALPQTIKPVYTPDNASMPQCNWASSVTTVATVDQNGEVTPVGQGQTIITATALDGSGLSATSTVTVTAPIDEDFGFDESVMGGVEGVTIYLGDTYTLVPKAHDGYQLPDKIVWSSSDDKIVSVDQNGKVTGLALGSATISATATINGKDITATCTVTVIPIKVSAIELSQTTAELRATETLTLTATIEPNNATDKSLQWTTNAPSIATVSQEGVVTALMIGEANITARALDGSNATASCLVKVMPTIATGITVKANGSTSIKATETVQLTATVTPETTTDKSVTWRSDKPAIASVNNSGVVTGVAVGEALITATNSAGKTADIKITVIPTPVETIELNRYTAQIRVQDGFKLNANILPLTATNKTVDWTSSAPEIVSVDNEGNVLALALGNATITCEAQDGSGVKAECQITVTTTATQSVSITAEGSTTLRAKETVQLRATVLPATASDKSVRWQSANPDIASVDNTGLVTAVSVGSVQITVTNSGGQTASVTITVIPTPVESIKLNKTSATLKATETLELIATVNPETATDKSLEWGSDNEAVAMVNQNGVVTAVATGEANITVKAKDGSNVTANCKVNVIATEVTSITISANGSTTLKASENVQLIATILPETATDKSVRWSASAPGIANVNENGLVTAYAVGESLITATASSGLTAELTITVIPTPVSNITLNCTSLTMRVGNERRLTATIQPETATDKSVTWASSNPEIATVDGEGNVIALLEGQTSITCTAKDGSGISASCIVNVVDTDVETVIITAEGSTTIKVSETVQLTATVMPETSTNKSISWSSGNEKVATVDAEGLVTAMSEGVTVITATTSNGLSDSITITVVETQVTSITLNETSIILQANDTYNLIPTINPQTATNKEVIWTSGNADIATVNQDGTVTAIMVGETSISASAADGSGVTASCKVTVIPTPATSITITVHGETTLEINQPVQLTAEVLPENATDKSVVWTSSNEAVASVTETGLVTALSAGETVITATNSAGQYDRVTITVISNEPDEPEVPEPLVEPADTPKQLLRKGDGTSHTFVAMMEKDDEVLEAENYRYVFGYNIGDGTSVIEDTPWRYAHTNEDIYWNSSNDFWVFAYYVDDEGTVHLSSRRHLDGSIDNDFNAADLIGSVTRSGEHIVGIYTVDGQYVGKDINKLETGIYIIRTSTSSYKIIR